MSSSCPAVFFIINIFHENMFVLHRSLKQMFYKQDIEYESTLTENWKQRWKQTLNLTWEVRKTAQFSCVK